MWRVKEVRGLCFLYSRKSLGKGLSRVDFWGGRGRKKAGDYRTKIDKKQKQAD